MSEVIDVTPETQVTQEAAKPLTIGEQYSQLMSTIYHVTNEIQGIDLPSKMNLDILAKQFEAEIKIMISHALHGRKELFEQSVSVLKTEVPKLVVNLVASAEKILIDFPIRKENQKQFLQDEINKLEQEQEQQIEEAAGEVIPA